MQKYRRIDRRSYYLLLLILVPLFQLGDRIINKNYYQLDLQIVRFIEQQRNWLLDFFFTNIYRITGTYFTGSVVLITLIILIRQRYWQEIKALVFATLGILLLSIFYNFCTISQSKGIRLWYSHSFSPTDWLC